MLTEKDLFEKAYGCLMGVACGDAMGMPTSMMSPETIKKTFGKWVDTFLPAPAGHCIHDKMKAGQITDDTQQTMLLVETIIEDGRITAEGIARRLIRWAESINAFDSKVLGPSSLRALNEIRHGKSLAATGAIGDTNGAAMKIAPVGIIHPGEVEATVEDVASVCLPTHNTNIAIAGASAVACAIAMAMVQSDMDGVITAFLKGIDLGMRKGNPWYGASLRRRTLWALDIVKSADDVAHVLQDLYDLIGAGVAITEAVPVSLALFVLAKGDPVRSIEFATNMGGDCDTVAAITGSIAGAHAGINAFPPKFITQIEEVNHLNLSDRAEKLVSQILTNRST